MKKIPKTIVTFNSSSVIPLKLIYKKLDIFNITFNIKFDVENKWHPLFDREDQIEHYFKSYLSIKSKELKIPK